MYTLCRSLWNMSFKHDKRLVICGKSEVLRIGWIWFGELFSSTPRPILKLKMTQPTIRSQAIAAPLQVFSHEDFPAEDCWQVQFISAIHEAHPTCCTHWHNLINTCSSPTAHNGKWKWSRNFCACEHAQCHRAIDCTHVCIKAPSNCIC